MSDLPPLSTDLPLVSIVTPSFNSAAYIERTILSIQAQDYPNLEHIVMDGGSKDGTVGILKRFPHLKWVSEPDKGQADAINKAIARAKGSIIGWLNADDLYAPDAVSKSVAYLLAHPEVVMTYSNCDIIDEQDHPIGKIVARDYHEFLHLAWFNVIPQPTGFFRREACARAGPLDASLHFCMDWEYWVRLGRVGRLARIPGTLAKFRLVEGTKTFSQNDKFYGDIRTVCSRYHVPSIGWELRKGANSTLSRLGLLNTCKSAFNRV